MAYVYRHIRLDKNEPFYIGIGSDETFRRAKSKLGRNKIWNDIVNKTQYEVEILFNDFTWEQAQAKEREFISLYGRIDNRTGILTNMTDGGDGAYGVIYSEERRARHSIALKGNKSRTGQKLSEEQKQKMSLALKGKKKNISKEGKENMLKARYASRGRKQSKEEIEKRRLKLIGKVRTEETKKKMSESMLGRKVSDESRRKMSEYWTGRKRKPFSQETLEKMSMARKLYYQNKNK